MKKRFFKILLFSIGILIICIIYINSSYFIQNKEWKYEEGTHVGDWLENGNIEIRDGIIYGNSGKAKIVFCLGYKLVIENIETGEKGFYVNKS